MLEECHDAEIDHIYHCCVAYYEEKECNLYHVVFSDVAKLKLLTDEKTDEVIFRGRKAFLNEMSHVLEK
jgi:hypothetical protein